MFSRENSPTFFVVYTHDAPKFGNANAEQARQIIEWLRKLRSIVFSDRSQFLPLYDRENGGAGRDILSNQLCLLPKRGRVHSVYNVKSVDKVILCCSEVLQNYCKDGHTERYIQAIKQTYNNTKDLENTDEVRNGIAEIVNTYSKEEWFHHVLTELAFLEIRSTQEERNHGIIPVVLNGDSIDYLSFSKKGVPLWLKLQEKSESTIHECQVLHKLLFRILRQIYTDKHQDIDVLERCYTNCVEKLLQEPGLPSKEDFNFFMRCQLSSGMKQIINNGQATSRG